MKNSTAIAPVPVRLIPGLAYLELTKPRVSTLVALTAGAGFYLGTDHPLQLAQLVWVVLGTGLLAGGAASLNQVMENRPDSLMKRTADRPIPSARLGPLQAGAFGVLLSVCGAWLLMSKANPLATVLGLLTSVIYLFAYTPLKRRSVLCTTVGAIPGGAPPLIGWAAATGHLDVQAWSLFLILFLWQYPHFLAIAWLYKDDYQKGGFKMLPMVDVSGRKTALQVVIFSILLLASSVLPMLVGLAGMIYLVGALILGVSLVLVSLGLLRNPSLEAARFVLKASLVYLPLLLILLMVDKL